MPPKKKIEKPMPKKSDAETILDKHFERKETPKKKISKKEETKIVKQVKETEAKKEEKKEEEILLPPKVVHELRRTEKFDLNWFYLKKRFVAFEKWLSTPYTKEFWRKHGFTEKTKEIKNFEEKQNVLKSFDIPKSISSVGDFNKPLTAEELAKIKRIRELILSDDFDKNIFRSEK